MEWEDIIDVLQYSLDNKKPIIVRFLDGDEIELIVADGDSETVDYFLPGEKMINPTHFFSYDDIQSARKIVNLTLSVNRHFCPVFDMEISDDDCFDCCVAIEHIGDRSIREKMEASNKNASTVCVNCGHHI